MDEFSEVHKRALEENPEKDPKYCYGCGEPHDNYLDCPLDKEMFEEMGLIPKRRKRRGRR